MAFFSEAVLDAESGALLKNADFTVTSIDGEEALVYTYDFANGYAPLPQPIMSDLNGNLQFWAEPGYYYLTRGGGSTLIELQGENIVEELTTVFLTNTSNQYSPESNWVTFYNCVTPISELTGSQTVSNWPSSTTYVYNGASDITLTLPNLCGPNTQFVVTQGGTGKVTVAATAPATRSNYSGHTKTQGPDATIFVCNVSTDPGTPEYRISGQTA